MSEIKVGDLVRIAKSSIDDRTTTWFARDAEKEVPFLVVGDQNEFSSCYARIKHSVTSRANTWS